MVTDTSTPRKRKAVKMRRLSVELRLQGQQLHRTQGAEPQRQDACGEARMAPYSLVSSPLPRPSTQHPPTALCLLKIDQRKKTPETPEPQVPGEARTRPFIHSTVVDGCLQGRGHPSRSWGPGRRSPLPRH